MVRSGVEVLSSFCFYLALADLNAVWPEAAALQAHRCMNTFSQLQVLLSQRIHASAGWVLLKHVSRILTALSALGLLHASPCKCVKVASLTPPPKQDERVFVCVPEEWETRRAAHSRMFLAFFYHGCQCQINLEMVF